MSWGERTRKIRSKKVIVLFVLLCMLVQIVSLFPLATDSFANVSTSNLVTIYYKNSYGSPFIHYRANGSTTWTNAPGVLMHPSEFTGYSKVTLSVSGVAEAAFNNGSSQWDNNGGRNYSFPTAGIYTMENGSIRSGDPIGTTNHRYAAIYYKKSGWSNANMHFKLNGSLWTAAPGVSMQPAEYQGYVKWIVHLGSISSMTAAFNYNNNWDNNRGSDYSFTEGTFTVNEGVLSTGAPSQNSPIPSPVYPSPHPSLTPTNSPSTSSDDLVTIYYRTSFAKPYIHFRATGASSWTNRFEKF